MPSARLLFNPASGGGRLFRQLEQAIREHALDARASRGPAELAEQARRAAEAGEERLLVAGGDGTIHAAIQGLAGTDCALGIVPTGTGNDLARSLGALGPPGAAIRRALGGVPRRIDLGRVDAAPFAGVAGLGLDGEVNRYIERRFPGSRRPWMYAWATLRTAYGFDPPRLRIQLDDDLLECRVLLAALANSPLFGGGMRIAPAASLDDGQLDLVIIEPISLFRMVLLFRRIYRGTHVGHAAVTCRPVTGATVSAERELTIYADGEPLHPLCGSAVPIRVWPAALSVV